MKIRQILIRIQSVILISILSLFFALPTSAADKTTMVAGLSTEEALRLGEVMYLKGILPSGKPMKSIVQGDLEVSGTMFTCANCHLRSGLGSFEGKVFTPPINGDRLYSPLTRLQDLIPGHGIAVLSQVNYKRRAYTDQSLATMLRSGVDPEGRTRSERMPRYILEDSDIEILIFYLKNLSSEYSPGVTADEVRLATVITEEVGTEYRNAMLEPLSAGSPMFRSMGRRGEYKRLSLDVWELKGHTDTWKGQLEDFYKKKPVFALIGGMSLQRWTPIHDFCEKNRIPCIFPITDLPEVSESDWYTLYFSRGYYQEGEAAAKYLARTVGLPRGKEIVQVFRDNDDGRTLSQGFEDEWKKLGMAAPANRPVFTNERTGNDFWNDLSSAHPNAAMILWLDPEGLAGIESLADMKEKPSIVFVSSTMLAGRLVSIPDKIRDFTFITYPTRLPDEPEHVSLVVDQWLKARKIPLTNMNISSKAHFLMRTVVNTLTNMKGNFYRDYFLDIFDGRRDQVYTAPVYPRLSFGPGQRYASKGCYIVTLTQDLKPKIVRQSEWTIY